MDTSWLEWIPAMVATVASLAAVLLAVGQLTAASHFRRQATFWREQLHDNDLAQDYDIEVAQSFYREATARLVGLEAYPGRQIFFWVFAVLSSCYTLGGYSFRTGAKGVDGFTLSEFLDQWAYILLAPVHLFFFLFVLFKVHDLIVLRRRMARRYLQRLDLARKRSIDEQGHESADAVDEWELSAWEEWWVVLFCVGFWLLIIGVSFDAGLRSVGHSISDYGDWWYLPLGIGFGLCAGGVQSVGKFFNQERDDWEHPRTLAPEDETPQNE